MYNIVECKMMVGRLTFFNTVKQASSSLNVKISYATKHDSDKSLSILVLATTQHGEKKKHLAIWSIIVATASPV